MENGGGGRETETREGRERVCERMCGGEGGGPSSSKACREVTKDLRPNKGAMFSPTIPLVLSAVPPSQAP